MKRHRGKLAWAVAGLATTLVVVWLAYHRAEKRAQEVASFEPAVLSAALTLYGSELTLRAGRGAVGSLFHPAAVCATPMSADDFRIDPWLERVNETLRVLEVMGPVCPEKPDVDYHLARAYVLLGDPRATSLEGSRGHNPRWSKKLRRAFKPNLSGRVSGLAVRVCAATGS